MIGNIGKGQDCYGLLRYCLNDKKELSEEDKIALSRIDGLQHKGRAEVLEYNLCFGNAKELAEQFKEVEKLSRRTEKPVFHISMSLSPGEVLNKNQLIDIGRACAMEFDVLDHQYVCILHKDTHEQHIHLVANRVGFDGLAAKDNNSYKRMAKLSRRLEKDFKLQAVLSPRSFLSGADRLLPRHDSRKEKLKNHIQQTLQKTTDYSVFERQMKALGYQVFKARGIYFIDDKKVRIKGSEVGYSLAKIEKILQDKAKEIFIQPRINAQPQGHTNGSETAGNNGGNVGQSTIVPPQESSSPSLLEQLMQSEGNQDYINPDLYRHGKPKKKRKSKHL